ncbi:MAG: hypothetical protein IPM53_02910 [Anaerolineaceae bacterium]|nr:hypothetical protein [Anaerolineaceae bacterium]
MKQKRVVVSALILLFIWVIIVTAVSTWQQVNNNGFGDLQASEVSAVEPFGDYLYAGTSNATNSARIFRSPDGLTWTPVIDPGFGNPHDTAPLAILDMLVFNGYLYASTGRGNAAQIWRTVDGVNWARVVNAGFGDPDIVNITVLAEFNGLIYAGATHSITGAQIWRSFTGDSNSWTQVAPSAAGTSAAGVTGFAVFDGALYAAVEFEDGSPVQIWRSFGGDWTAVMTNGFGNSNTVFAGGMAEFSGYLYVGAGNTVHGAQLWRSGDGTNWTQVINLGFGGADNEKAELVYTFQNQLYVSEKNLSTGLAIWRSSDGLILEQANLDGFGDSENINTNWSNATANFLNQLYVGTTNAIDGGELWQQEQPFGVDLSPNATLQGAAGQIVTYTLSVTNTGKMIDTFNLGVAGNSWVTELSAPSIVLAPGSSSTFTVAVTIPSYVSSGTADIVTLTATSQGNLAINDSVTLTTQCLEQAWRISLPLVIRTVFSKQP